MYYYTTHTRVEKPRRSPLPDLIARSLNVTSTVHETQAAGSREARLFLRERKRLWGRNPTVGMRVAEFTKDDDDELLGLARRTLLDFRYLLREGRGIHPLGYLGKSASERQTCTCYPARATCKTARFAAIGP